MEKFLKVTFVVVFTVLIAGSIQNVLAENIGDMFKPTPIGNSEYKFHLLLEYRDADGKLISVIESTNGYYIPHKITDEAFDFHFGTKEIVTIENVKYEKVQFREKYSLGLPMKLMFFIPANLEVYDGQQVTLVDANIFQALVPLVYLEEGYVINTQWTIFREIS